MLTPLQKNFASIAALILATFLTFAPCLFNQFTLWDDPQMLTKNALVTDITASGLKNIFQTFTNGSYVPMTILSYAFEYHFFQYNPKAYHATNLILHIINVLFVFWLLSTLTKNNLISLITALLFAVNPLRVESVAWVSERKDVLFAFFLLASLICYVYFILNNRKTIHLYWACLILFILSCLTKPQAFILPFILIILDAFTDPKSWKKHLASKIPFFIISITFIYIGQLSLTPLVSGQTYYQTYNTIDKVLLTAHSIIFYITQSLLPFLTSCVYPYPAKISHSFPILTYLSPLILVILTLYIFYKFRKDRITIFAFWFFCITLSLPLLNIWLGGYFAADRYMYLPSIGLFLGLTHGTVTSFENKFKPFKQWNILLFAVYILFLSTLSLGKCFVWKNDITLWGNAIDLFPNMPISYVNRAAKFMFLRDTNQALNDLNRSLELDPEYVDAYFNRALIYTDTKNYELAIEDNSKIIQLDSKQSEAYNNRGYCYFKMHNYESGIKDFTIVLKLDPSNQKALLNRAYCYVELKDYDNARADFNQLLKINPKHPSISDITEILQKIG